MDRFNFHVRNASGNLHFGKARRGSHNCACCVDLNLRHGKGKKMCRRIGRHRFKTESKSLIAEQFD